MPSPVEAPSVSPGELAQLVDQAPISMAAIAVPSLEILVANGIAGDRIKIKAGVAAQGNGEAQSVLFVVCEQPY